MKSKVVMLLFNDLKGKFRLILLFVHCSVVVAKGCRTVKWRDWQGIEAAKQTIEFPAAPFFFLVKKIEKMNQINTKNYWK